MFGRRSITAKASFSDDEDAITPCSSPPPEAQQQIHYEPRTSLRFSLSRRGSSSAVSSAQAWHFDPTDGEDMDDAKLWRRMLDIQREFHCYNSARMAAALLELEMGMDVSPYAPSRSCLDLLNDSVSDMSDIDKERLVDWLHEHSNSKRKRSGIFKRSSVF
ncbi:hypothetical protein VP1G_00695 [Cytospora mali]|uniref:Uncharacterized protein n=1 Tax=Cytospora mali TaxID=578113 RepID=A0A194UNY6_CYTMA|nr:hypothetical protein VP1G_00695 [Valsa mali var. pyri (nom. inval.)]